MEMAFEGSADPFEMDFEGGAEANMELNYWVTWCREERLPA